MKEIIDTRGELVDLSFIRTKTFSEFARRTARAGSRMYHIKPIKVIGEVFLDDFPEKVKEIMYSAEYVSPTPRGKVYIFDENYLNMFVHSGGQVLDVLQYRGVPVTPETRMRRLRRGSENIVIKRFPTKVINRGMMEF